jgi:hypothetical protein
MAKAPVAPGLATWFCCGRPHGGNCPTPNTTGACGTCQNTHGRHDRRRRQASAVYRSLRPQLVGACPVDVWVEGDHGFVQFDLDEDSAHGRPGWLLFGVRLADGGLVAAKLMDPGPGEMELTVSDLLT